jgi:hypothetical protein
MSADASEKCTAPSSGSNHKPREAGSKHSKLCGEEAQDLYRLGENFNARNLLSLALPEKQFEQI